MSHKREASEGRPGWKWRASNSRHKLKYLPAGGPAAGQPLDLKYHNAVAASYVDSNMCTNIQSLGSLLQSFGSALQTRAEQMQANPDDRRGGVTEISDSYHVYTAQINKMKIEYTILEAEYTGTDSALIAYYQTFRMFLLVPQKAYHEESVGFGAEKPINRFLFDLNLVFQIKKDGDRPNVEWRVIPKRSSEKLNFDICRNHMSTRTYAHRPYFREKRFYEPEISGPNTDGLPDFAIGNTEAFCTYLKEGAHTEFTCALSMTKTAVNLHEVVLDERNDDISVPIQKPGSTIFGLVSGCKIPASSYTNDELGITGLQILGSLMQNIGSDRSIHNTILGPQNFLKRHGKLTDIEKQRVVWKKMRGVLFGTRESLQTPYGEVNSYQVLGTAC